MDSPGQFRWSKINVIFDWNQSNLLGCNLNALLGNCAVEKKQREGISTPSVRATVTCWIEIIAFVLLLSLLLVCPCPRLHFLQASNKVILSFFIWQDKASSIILPWKPHFSNPPLPLPVAAPSNDAQIDTLAPPPFLPLFSECPSIPCLFPQMPPSLREYQINEIDLSFLVIHQPLFVPCMS